MTNDNDANAAPGIATHTLMVHFKTGQSAGVNLAVGTGETPSITELERGPALSYGFPLAEVRQIPDGRVLYLLTGPDGDANKNDDPEFRDQFRGDATFTLFRHAGVNEDLGDDDDTMIPVILDAPIKVEDGVEPQLGILVTPGSDVVRLLSPMDFRTSHADLLLQPGTPQGVTKDRAPDDTPDND